MSWRPTILTVLSLASLLLVAPVVAAQTQQPQITSISQFLRSIGHNLSDAEAAFLDADEQIQAPYAIALQRIDLLSRVDPGQRNDQWRQALIDELQRIVNTDPSVAPQAPSNLQRLRELAIAQRTYFWRAARQWLDAVQAGDPEWLQRGADDFRAGTQAMSNWQQEMLSRYPPPQQ